MAASWAELPALASGHGLLGDTDWKQAGLWAIDTVNSNSWTTAEASILPRTAADVLIVQETKRGGDEAVQLLKTQARRKAWNFAASHALRTAADSASGGCAVGVRRDNGISPRRPPTTVGSTTGSRLRGPRRS